MYTIGNLLLKAFNFFLIPLYTAFLTTEEYGTINLASGFYTLMASLIIFSLQYAVIRFYADIHSDSKKVARMFGTVINFIILISFFFLVIAFIGKNLITSWFFKGVSFFPVVFLSILISIVTGLYQVYQDILKGMQNAQKSIWMSYLYFFLMLGLNILSVVYLKLGAVGVLFSTLIVNGFMVVLMFVDLIKHGLYAFCIDRNILEELLKYSLPLVPHTVAYNVQTYATKVIINGKLSLSMLGIYSLSSQFGSIADVILNSVQAAFQPWFYKVLNEGSENDRKRISSISYALMWLYGLFFIGIGAFSQEAILIMADSSYAQSWIYVPLIVLTFTIKAPLYFYVNFLYYDKRKTKYIFISTVIGCIVNVSLTALLVPYFHILGSIIADVIAMIIRLLFTIVIVRQDAKKIYSFSKLQLYSFIPMIFMALSLLLSILFYKEEISITNVIYKTVIVLAYVVVAFIVNRDFVKMFLRNTKK